MNIVNKNIKNISNKYDIIGNKGNNYKNKKSINNNLINTKNQNQN